MEITLRHLSSVSLLPFGGWVALEPRSADKVAQFQVNKFQCRLQARLWFPPVWSKPTWDERQAHTSQAEAFHFWLRDTGWETCPTSQLVAWTRASFAADISPSAKANQAPLSLAAILRAAFTTSPRLPSSCASSLHVSECLWGRGRALWDAPVSLCFAGQEPVLVLRSQAQRLGRHRNYSDKSKMHPPLLGQNVAPSFCL